MALEKKLAQQFWLKMHPELKEMDVDGLYVTPSETNREDGTNEGGARGVSFVSYIVCGGCVVQQKW